MPYLLHYTQGSVVVNQLDQELFFEINHPQEWSFAKISVINSKDGKVDTTTIMPEKNSSIEIYENSLYWIDAKIRVNGTSFDAFNTIKITTLDENPNRFEIIDIPEKQIGIIAGIVILVGVVGLIKRR
jgi:minor extracellular serine protease Vpr